MTLEQELALAALRHEEIRTEVADGTVLLDNDVRDTIMYDLDKLNARLTEPHPEALVQTNWFEFDDDNIPF